MLEQTVDQRKNRRVKVNRKLAFSHRDQSIKLGQVINISMGGLGYLCNHCIETLGNNDRVTIYYGKNTFCVTNISYKLVWYKEEPSPKSSHPVKYRGGLQFLNLTPSQKAQLEYLINLLDPMPH